MNRLLWVCAMCEGIQLLQRPHVMWRFQEFDMMYNYHYKNLAASLQYINQKKFLQVSYIVDIAELGDDGFSNAFASQVSVLVCGLGCVSVIQQ